MVVIAMKKELKQIRQDLEEHLSAINENTLEIQALLDYLQEIEIKTDKLSQRLDQLQLKDSSTDRKLVILPLDQLEKKIFLVLYTEHEALSYSEIAKKSSLPASLIPEAVSSLVQKGLPLQRSYFNNHLFFQLDASFKELQAKENLVNLSLQSFLKEL